MTVPERPAIWKRRMRHVRATIWMTVLDDQLEAFYGQSYKTARAKTASAWSSRVCGGHAPTCPQLRVTLDKDQTPFFGGGKGSSACP
jgi:hypothetical protein